MGRRRLCMIVHGPYPVGEPRVAREAAAALDGGWEVDVVAMQRDGEPRRETVENVAVVRLPVAHHRGARAWGVLFEYVSFAVLATFCAAALAIRRRYSVVQVHNPPDFLVAAALVPRALGAKLILDVHDLSSDMFAMRFEGRRGLVTAERMLRAIEAQATRLADAVITVHEPYRQELVVRGVPPGKVSVVMNSVDERVLPREQAVPAEGTFRVFYHGTVTRHYGVDLIVDACAKLADRVPGLVIELCGEGDDLNRIRANAARSGLDRRLEATGRYLPHREVLRRAQFASVGVIPNLPTRLNKFALSTKLFEYVTLGIPVVSADLPTIKAHFSSDEVMFFHAGDAEALAEALLSVARDRAAAEARARAAAKRYEQYSWRRHAAQYLDLLDALATRH